MNARLTEAERRQLLSTLVPIGEVPPHVADRLFRRAAAILDHRIADALAPVVALADEWETRAERADHGKFSERPRWIPAMRNRAADLRAALSPYPAPGLDSETGLGSTTGAGGEQ